MSAPTPPNKQASAVSYLFVPATRPDRVRKAGVGIADQVIVDLEDAVAPDEKSDAREGLGSMVPTRPLCVRVNAVDTPFFEDDLVAVAALEWVTAVVVPKVERTADVAEIRRRLPDLDVVALIESARGILAVDAIAASGVARLMFGVVDYTSSLGAEGTAEVLAYPRTRLVLASSAAGIAPPIDGPSVFIDRPEVVAAETHTARAFGFRAKACIHPSQLDVVHEVFASSEEERAWARRVLEVAGSTNGVFSLDGQMVDEPVIARARRLAAGGP